ncbi:efflux RND transporter permease subunit [Pseudoalteromonas luteoviolacea]|uniref:Acriflavine resistance protein B n=1 Tax=Pseudoalteromonas luteoviolacea NCIMB 1942 TaxID=1365253 RepID=A0A167I443_9GAMM|nr:efflux RND transporter permease subunit [Pseudoalteromonas luteoviolacea]KZN58873.1 acriflavine resistance protein B [Pseudoalteromonas luteoviolacea NCIMB 1942]KZW99134.1 acriflavine resistance protein B [Pseudoalteromonas luteoviolacea]
MNLTRSSLKNPASVIVLLVLVMVFGLLSIFKLPIQLTPDIEQPQITIFSGWRQAAPEEVESVILEPLENAVKNTPGALQVDTTINRGNGFITLTFAIGTDMQQAMLDVLTNLNQAPPLPLDAIDPVVSAGGSFGGSAGQAATLLVLPLDAGDEGLSFDMAQYQKHIEEIVEPRLAQIPGISRVDLASERSRELRITFDPHKAAALGISLNQIRRTLQASRDTSAGLANVGRRQYTVRFTGQYDLQDMLQMRIGYSNERPIYLGDIATVEETFSDRLAMSGRNGQPAYYIRVARINDANTVALLDNINIAIKELNAGPLKEAGLSIELSFDASVHIRNALLLVKSNLGLGVLLSCIILWLFFRGLRTTLVIAATIPVSLMVAFLALNIFDRSINVISLAGLAFAVGLVLDAAIIVQENIARLKTEGMDNAKAALKGAAQVAGALFASTATSVAIFLPIMFMAGIEGQLFSDLALTLSIAVIASLVSALTIIPIANRYLPDSKTKQDPYKQYWHKLTGIIMALTNTRTKQVSWITGLIGGSLFITVTMLPKTDFMPQAPTDGFFFSLVTPPGANITYMEEELLKRVKARLMPYYNGEKQPGIKSFNQFVFGSNAGGFIYSADPQRVEELMKVAKEEILVDLPDTQVFLFRGSMIQVSNGGDGRNINIDLTGPNMDDLIVGAQTALAAVKEAMPEATAQPQPRLDMAEPELRLHPNDRRITQAGLTRQDVSQAMQAFTGGLFINEYFNGNDRMNVILRATSWDSPEELKALPIVTPDSGVQTVGELARVERTVGPSQLRRVNGRRTVSVVVTPPANMTLEQAQQILVSQVLPKVKETLPSNAGVILAGNAQKLNSAIQEMALNFVLALFILFLLMSALFKSAKDSLLVLMVMPMAAAGGVIALYILNLFTFQSLDLLTMIGFIILLGLVVNNAILLVDQTRVAETKGLARQEAVRQAVLMRARPVYLSTLTSLFGMLPLTLVPGVGSEIYRGLATVIVGGMAISALFTLILMPSLLQLGKAKNPNSNKQSEPQPKLNLVSNQ